MVNSKNCRPSFRISKAGHLLATKRSSQSGSVLSTEGKKEKAKRKAKGCLNGTGGTFTVTLIASAGPCSDTAYTVIVLQDSLNLIIPNVFTPNGDGTNDFFTIRSAGVKEISLQIFNRWGEKMYELTGPKASWDGVGSNGTKVADGTYFYFVKAYGYDSKEIEQHGTVNLFR